MLTRSTKSLVTIKSLSEEDLSPEQEQSKVEDNKIPTTVFEELLPYLLKKFNSLFDTVVKKEYIIDRLDIIKSANVSLNTQEEAASRRKQQKKDENEMSTLETLESSNVITLTAFYDKYDELVEILINKQKRVPRSLLQVLAMTSPIYDMLTKITIKRCRMESDTIYELKKLLDPFCLTEICLDGSYVPEGNFAILLEQQSNLTYLSLCRCWINDDVCETIVSKMHYQAVGEKLLLTLHLSGNLITDEGAKSISKMLRSNRYLRYLNFAGNRITDEGASLILDVLREFRLTLNENSNRRLRIMHYMKRKNKLVSKFLTECVMETTIDFRNEGNQLSEKKREKKDVRVQVALNKSETMPNLIDEERLRQADASAAFLVGQYHDPFGVGKIVLRDGWAHCKGNFSLCYLNLAYNNLTHFSVKRVLDVLLYQQDIDRYKPKEPSLMKIVLEGNLMPGTCPEYAQISEIINKNLFVDKSNAKKRQSSKSLTRKSVAR